MSDEEHAGQMNGSAKLVAGAPIVVAGPVAGPVAGETEQNQLGSSGSGLKGGAAKEEVFEADAASLIDAADAPAATFDDEIQRLSKLTKLEYDKERKAAAKRLCVRVSSLDDAVQESKPNSGSESLQGNAVTFEVIEPWEEAVDGIKLLNELTELFRSHLVLRDGGEFLLALWVVHTHIYKLFKITPRLAVVAPEKECGKTTALELVELLVPRGKSASNLTTAVIFRMLDQYKPTLLIDEADTFLSKNDEMRGVLNAGHKRGGKAYRCEGDKHELREFDVFAPIAIASIKQIPSTLQSRSVTLNMRRALRSEKMLPITDETENQCRELHRKVIRWTSDNMDAFKAAKPAIPSAIINRKADNWRPLLAVAQVAGGDWIERSVALSSSTCTTTTTLEKESIGIRLLRDIRNIDKERYLKDKNGAPFITTAAVLSALIDMDESEWKYMWDGKTITDLKLAQNLRPYDLKSEGIKFFSKRDNKDKSHRGYRLRDLEPVFDRYLPPAQKEEDDEEEKSTSQPATPPQPATAATKLKSKENYEIQPATDPLPDPLPEPALPATRAAQRIIARLRLNGDARPH